MSIKKTVCCDICGKEYTEKNPNDGFPNWGQIMGINLNGTDNPYVCPYHLAEVADFIDNMVIEESK